MDEFLEMNVCIIPARGGSKRIPRKNIRTFCGKPIIGWSIERARESGVFDRLVVSTDDSEIAEIARDFGAETPFLRPPELANDHIGVRECIRHGIQELGLGNGNACVVYATAPLLLPSDISEGLRLLQVRRLNFVIGAARYPHPIQRAFRQTEEGNLEMFFPHEFESRSQDLPPAFHDAGQFCWGTVKAWKSDAAVFGKDAGLVVIDDRRVVDIDDELDWDLAELRLRILNDE